MSYVSYQGCTQRAEQRHDRIPRATILLVDDYEDSREMLKKLLEMDGYLVLEADNGVEAVRLTAQEKPDLVIMDLGLPLLNGIDAAKQIRSIPETNSIPIVALT